MKRVLTVIILPMLILSLAGLDSCRGKKKELKEVQMDQIQGIDSTIEKNVYPMPTSAEVIRMLSELEVGYIIGISNPLENSKKYLTSPTRAINIGVYGADLSYATLYNIQQKVIDYLNVIQSLANDLNMSKVYDQTLYDKIKENFDNRDQLVEILKSAFNNTYSYLSDNEQQSLALLVVGGAWVEGMFLTTHVSEAAYQISGISKVLLEQKSNFDLFLEITKPYLNDPNVSEFVGRLEPMRKVYEGLTTSLTNQNIMDITKAIEGIRSQII